MKKISRKLHLLPIFPLFALLFFVGAATIQAATYYVATTGNDSNPGTVAQPFLTIARGVKSLTAGDTLYIRSGTWAEQIDMSAKTGTPGNYITVAAYPGESVTIATSAGPFAIKGTYSASNAYFIFDGLIMDGRLQGDGSYWTIGGQGGSESHDIIVKNCEIKNWKGNGLLIGANNIQIQNCKIHDQIAIVDQIGHRWYGIYYHHGVNGVIEGNEIYNNPGGGIQAYPGTISNLLIRRNIIHDNNSLASSSIGGIIVAQESGTTITGLEISNNLIYKNGSAPIHGSSPGLQIAWGASGVKVWNNTIYGNQGYGIDVAVATSANNVIQNNIVYGNLYPMINDVGIGTIKDHNLTVNPNFVNAAAFDFKLQTSSPAIDAGVNLSQVTMDLRKNPRPQGAAHDLGAYEGGNNPPAPPRNLTVR